MSMLMILYKVLIDDFVCATCYEVVYKFVGDQVV